MIGRDVWHEFHDAGLSRRVSYLLVRAGFTTVEEIATIRDECLDERLYIGPATVAEVRRVIPYQPEQLRGVACPHCGRTGKALSSNGYQDSLPAGAGDRVPTWEVNG